MKKKLLSALLSVAILFSLMSCLSQGVFATTKTTTVQSSTMHRVIATSTTVATTKTSNNPVQTIYHEQGKLSTRCLGGTYYYESTDSLTSPLWPATFRSHANALGLVGRKQMVASSALWCEIDPKVATGTYKVYLRYSGVRLTQKVVTTYSGGSQTNQNRTISYVPNANSRITSMIYRK